MDTPPEKPDAIKPPEKPVTPSVRHVEDGSPDLQLADLRRRLQDVETDVFNSRERETNQVRILQELSTRVPMKAASQNMVNDLLAQLAKDLGL